MQRLQETLDDRQCHREHLASLYGLAKLKKGKPCAGDLLEGKAVYSDRSLTRQDK